MLKKSLTALLLLFVTCFVNAQPVKVWTLDDCIKYAEEHNIDIQKQSLTIDKSNLDLQESRWAFVPSLSASSGFTSSTGRVLDPTTYQFVQTNLTSNSSSSLEGNITLFEGGKKQKNLERAKLSLRASILKEESVKYNLKLNVTSAYLDVLCALEQEAIARKSAGLIEIQLERSQNLFEAGSITESDVLQLRSQLFSAQNDISSALQAEKMAKLAICDLLEIEDFESFKTAESQAPEEYMAEADIETAITYHPDYLISVLNQNLAETDWKIAKSALYPTLSLSAGYGSSWSDARKKSIQNPDGTIRYEAYPFFEQYADNASAYVSVGLKIPILTGLKARNSTIRAQLAVKESQYETSEVYKKLRKQVIQAKIDCETARDKYNRAIEEVKYAEEAYRQISDKYNLGATDYLNWNTALVELAKSQYSLIESKYSFYLKCKILNFYYEQQ